MRDDLHTAPEPRWVWALYLVAFFGAIAASALWPMGFAA